MKPTVYIAGKVTGLPREQCLVDFDRASYQLKSMGFRTINPMHLVPENASWTCAMKICITELVQCDYIFLLPNWKSSKGAIIEYCISRLLGIKRIKIQNYGSKV